MGDRLAFRISSNPFIARDTMVLRFNGEIVYAGPIACSACDEMILNPSACDEMILNLEDEADCLDYIEARIRERAT